MVFTIKKIYSKQGFHYDRLLLRLKKKTKSNVGFTENKIQSLKEMHRSRHFYMDASNLSASTSTTTQRTCCYRNSTESPEVRPNILNMECKQRSTPFWRPCTTTLTIGMLLYFSIKKCVYFEIQIFLILKSNQSRDQNFQMRLLSLSTSASAL